MKSALQIKCIIIINIIIMYLSSHVCQIRTIHFAAVLTVVDFMISLNWSTVSWELKFYNKRIIVYSLAPLSLLPQHAINVIAQHSVKVKDWHLADAFMQSGVQTTVGITPE